MLQRANTTRAYACHGQPRIDLPGWPVRSHLTKLKPVLLDNASRPFAVNAPWPSEVECRWQLWAGKQRTNTDI
jgi:hypothetical protein